MSCSLTARTRTHPCLSLPFASKGMDCSKVGDLLFGDKVHSHNGHHYQLIGDTSSHITWMQAFHDSLHRCHNGHSGYLATVESREENDFLLGLVKQHSTYSQKVDDKWLWLGGIDMNTEGKPGARGGESLAVM